jgi:hypothetical protein
MKWNVYAEGSLNCKDPGGSHSYQEIVKGSFRVETQAGDIEEAASELVERIEIQAVHVQEARLVKILVKVDGETQVELESKYATALHTPSGPFPSEEEFEVDDFTFRIEAVEEEE